MLSIIIPIYNREKTLDVCICSVLNTHYKDLEIILVDDGSTDSSLEICRKYQKKDNRISVLTKENGGVSSARNMGMDYACGDWITFVDSDDAVMPEHFSIVEVAEKFGADMTMCRFTQGYYDKGNISLCQKKKQLTYSEYIGNNAILNFLYDEINPYTHPNFFCHDKCFQRKLLKEYGIRFPESVSLGEDQIFVCEYLKHANHLLYCTSESYVRVLWRNNEPVYSLGGGLRSNENYLYNIKLNYEALKSLYEESKSISVFKYSMNYLLDRPMRLVIMHRCRTIKEHLKNYTLIKDAMIKSIPLLLQGKRSLNCVVDRKVRILDWLLLHCGVFITMIAIRIVIDCCYIIAGIKYKLVHL